MHPFYPKLLQNNESLLTNRRRSFISFRAAEENPEFRYVQLLVEITKIGEIDTLNERYQAEFYIEAKWVEKHAAADMVEYDPRVHWNPKIYVENTHQDPKETVRYDLARDEDNNLTITEIRHIKGICYSGV
jgi:hypothetical protein